MSIRLQVEDAGVYSESYRRIIEVLERVGVEWEVLEDGRRKIAPRLKDIDICLSPLDKFPQETNGPADLGAILLSAQEPSVTRQLNVLSNIVRRALLFGGDQELEVLSETLLADRPSFLQRWYADVEKEDDAPGVQFLDSLIDLLQQAATEGQVAVDDNDTRALIPSFQNAYERLTSNLVAMGSGYFQPDRPLNDLSRFATWETQFRTDVENDDDLLGSWTVRDAVGGQTIGMSTVTFLGQGQLRVDPPLRGLSWRLEPGPTHLDTCIFQVLGDDGAVLEYRGYVDRGARIESRFSKRPLQIRGSVMFQMRDELRRRTATTQFIMNQEG